MHRKLGVVEIAEARVGRDRLLHLGLWAFERSERLQQQDEWVLAHARQRLHLRAFIRDERQRVVRVQHRHRELGQDGLKLFSGRLTRDGLDAGCGQLLPLHVSELFRRGRQQRVAIGGLRQLRNQRGTGIGRGDGRGFCVEQRLEVQLRQGRQVFERFISEGTAKLHRSGCTA